MPTLPLTLPAPLDGGELPVTSSTDVAKAEPYFVRRATVAPVRDAFRAGLVALFAWYQRAASYAAAQVDILRATGLYLDGLGRDFDVFRQDGEGHEAYRARILAGEDVVTPAAILAAVNATLAPYTTIEAQYAESIMDRWFVEDGTATWSSHVWSRNGDRVPYYPDRLYEEQSAENGGYVREQSAPMGALPFSDDVGRHLVVRIPDLAAVDENVAYAFSDAGGTVATYGLFVGDGTETVDLAFAFSGTETEDAIYAAVVNAVERIKGHGIRWTLYVDPNLT